MPAQDIYNTIVISPEPRGRFFDGIINGTPLPGVVVQLDLGVESVGGKFTYEVVNVATEGDHRIGPILVLLEDQLQGKTITDAYVSGKQCFLYAPLPGDELLMQVEDIAGTGDDYTIGQALMINDAGGELLGTTGVIEEPFVSMETITDPTAAALLHVMFAG